MPYDKVCDGCRESFTARDVRQRYCRIDCRKRSTGNQSRSHARAIHVLRFVGVDGEGVDRPDGTHEYVMLSVGDQTLTNNGYQLSLNQILSFLWKCYQRDTDACYVGFFLGYDFIQWEKMLPESVARSLLTTSGILSRTSQRKSRKNPFPDAVVWEGWEIDVMANRRFKVRPHAHTRSQWNTLCTNRTCREPIEGAVTDGPRFIYPGELEFTPSEKAVDWSGTSARFWKESLRAMRDSERLLNRVPESWLYICDTGPFWQTSFLNVINPDAWKDSEPVCTPEEYALIAAGKADRGMTAERGDTSYFPEMVKYNVLENAILGRVTERLNQGFADSEISIKIPRTDWYGPGRAAQLWMDMLHARIADPSSRQLNRLEKGSDRANEYGLLNADIYMSLPSWYYDAARASYYGGWFEQFMHGHIGNVWEYDVNSAYPFIIASLPCLHNGDGHTGVYSQGRTDNGDTVPENEYTLVYGTFRGSDAFIGAMPYRSRQGLISRPQSVIGWYWLHEVNASVKAKLIDTMDIEEWVSYRACHCQPPFNPDDIGIERLYELRLRVGKNTPQGMSAKLVYNSAYGKTAQSVGKPKYANPVYASLITAGCRTLILEAIASHPSGSSAVSMVATDGIYFTEPHPKLDLHKTRLGSWDETFKPSMTQLMPGVYWDDTTRERIRDGQSPKLKSRGINARDLADEISHLDALFAEAHFSLTKGREYVWPSLTIRVRFLLDSAKSALHRGKWEQAGRVQHDSRRTLSSNPFTKRDDRAYRDVSTGITRTRPYREGPTGIDTTPYHKSFGYHQTEDGLFGDAVTQDGIDPLMYWRDVINA